MELNGGILLILVDKFQSFEQTTAMNYINLIVLILASTTGLMVISYQGIAKVKGWGVGASFDTSNSYVLTVPALILLLASLVLSVVYNPWWSLFIVLVAGFVVNMLLTVLFKQKTQYLALVLLIVSTILLFTILE